MEIDQESHSQIQQAKVREKLSLVYWMESFLALDLNDYLAIDNEASLR